MEDENRKNSELSGLNKQASWMMDMMYGKRDDTSARRDSLTNIQDLASRISSLQEKEAVENGGSAGVIAPDVNVQASVKVRCCAVFVDLLVYFVYLFVSCLVR